MKKILSCAPLSSGERGVMIVNSEPEAGRASRRNSRYPVMSFDLARIVVMLVSLNILRDERRMTESITGVLDSWNARAPV